jgi:hypothetical protein
MLKAEGKHGVTRDMAFIAKQNKYQTHYLNKFSETTAKRRSMIESKSCTA